MNQRYELYQIVNSIYSSNTYLLSISVAEKIVYWIIDIGDIDKLQKILPKNAIIGGILLTHTHFDHIYGINDFIKIFPKTDIITNSFGAKALLSPKLNFSKYHQEAENLILSKPENIMINDGGMVENTYDINITAYPTPGHDKSCMTFVMDSFVFSGDAYIPGIKTRATLPNSEKQKVSQSESFIKRIASGLTLCPGHGPYYDKFKY